MTLFQLGRQARLKAGPVQLRPDGTVALWPDSPVQPQGDVREIHIHPRKGESGLAALPDLRAHYPQAKVHGLSPGWLSRYGQNVLREVDSLCWFSGELTGPSSPPSQDWQLCATLDIPKVACFIYGPEHSVADLEARLVHFHNAIEVVPLPRAVGDLVVVPGATTDGTWDMEVLTRCRALLPRQVRVRASWAALGWKLAQSSLAFGVDSLGGWGLEEQLAYSGKMRPASQVDEAEALAGLKELS